VDRHDTVRSGGSFPRIFSPIVLEANYIIALVLLRLGHFRRASLAYLAGI
jgi:hypothetical protein